MASRVVLFLLGAVWLVLNSGQGEELTASLLVLPAYNNWLLFLSLFAWAAQSWFWARLAIELSVPSARSLRTKVEGSKFLLFKIVPVVCAGITLLIPILHFFRAGRTGLVTLIGVGSIGLFAAFFAWIGNRDVEIAIEGTPKHTALRPLNRWAVGFLSRLLDIAPTEKPTFSWWALAAMASYAWSISWAFVGVLVPLTVAKSFGTLGTVFIALSVLIPLMSTAIIATRHANIPSLLLLILAPFCLPTVYGWLFQILISASGLITVALGILAAAILYRGYSILGIVLGLVVLSLAYLTYTGPAINLGIQHEVRHTLEPSSLIPCVGDYASGGADTNPDPKQCSSNLDAEVDKWLNGLETVSRSGTNYVVFVSAAGGGLRAAYWAAAILSRVNDCTANFNQRLFAISGVSGGSLGAALYAALVRDEYDNDVQAKGTGLKPSACNSHPISVADVPARKGWMQSQLLGILQDDFLAPVIANLLFRDLPQAIIPINILPDRAVALERAFEQAWNIACRRRAFGPRCAHENQLSDSFFEVRKTKRWIPVLLFNGTHQETGKRIVTSSIQVDQSIFFDSYDFFDMTGRDIALSTAVLNSARFPLVSPAGTLTFAGSATEARGHIIDGGFFENDGAITLYEVANATLDRIKKRTNDRGQTWKPFVIEIINDVEMKENDLARATNSLFSATDHSPLAVQPGVAANTPFANELISAVAGLYATRTARGILASKMLADFTRMNEGEFVQFRLCPQMKPSPPLGWLLTAESRQAMDQIVLGQSRSVFRSKYEDASALGAPTDYLKCFGEIQQQLSFVVRTLRDLPPQHAKDERDYSVSAEKQRIPTPIRIQPIRIDSGTPN